jgi:glycosyltransferase involved in cell wall biosynthesis
LGPLEVVVVDAYPSVVGGAHVVARDLAVAGRSTGRWRTTVLLPGEGAAAAWLREEGVPVVVQPAPPALLRFGGTSNPVALLLALPRYWWGMSKALKPYGLVHANDLRGLVLAGPAALIARRRVLLHVHAGEAGGAPWRALVRLLLAARVVIAVPSRHGARGWIGTRGDRLVELPNPVAPQRKRVEGPEPVLVTVARLHPDKGLECLLEAIELLRENGVPVQGVVVGPDAPGFEEHARSLRQRAARTGAVRFVGRVADPFEHLATAWVYVQPSRRESFGVAALEASACGLPVVATTAGGLPDVVVDGVTGALVAPADPRALALVLESLLGSGELRRSLGEAGRARALRDFGGAAFAARVGALYERVMA